MSYPINYPTPQGANVQIFRGGDSTTASVFNTLTKDWVKPQGASFVWFTLIGAGGGGGGGNGVPGAYYGGGGASGNVTNFMCPAFLIPDVLQISIGRGGYGGTANLGGDGDNGAGGSNTIVYYQQKNTLGYQLLVASGGNGGVGGSTSGGNQGSGGSSNGTDSGGPMTAAGFYNSIANQAGANGSSFQTISGTTFVMSGSGLNNGTAISGYYGYTAANGYSQLSPIPNCISGGGVGSRPSPFGCGGNGDYTNGCQGGDGLAIIVTW